MEAELGICRNRGQLRRLHCVLIRHPSPMHQGDSPRSALSEEQATEGGLGLAPGRQRIQGKPLE